MESGPCLWLQGVRVDQGMDININVEGSELLNTGGETTTLKIEHM